MTEREFYYFNSRLTAKLNSIRKKPLTIVKASMAAGKTTAVRSYVDNLKCRYSWNASSEEPFESWIRNFVSHLEKDILQNESRLDQVDLEQSVSAIASSIATVLKHLDRGMARIYVLDCSGRIDERIAKFLYQLAAQRIDSFHVVLMSRFHLFPTAEILLQDYVNYISDDCFMLTDEEIVLGFGSYGIRLIPEEAALIYRYTSGWMPAVDRVFQQMWRVGKARTYIGMEELFASWVMLASSPEELSFSKGQWELMKALCDYRNFTLEDACGVWNDERAAEVPEYLNVGNLPSFLYYDDYSGKYYMHYLLRKSLRNQERLQGTGDNMMPVRKADGAMARPIDHEEVYDLVQLILRFTLKDAEHRIQMLEFASDDTPQNACLLWICRAAVRIFSGNEEAGMAMLHTAVANQLHTGNWKLADELTNTMILMRIVRGGDWSADIVEYCAYLLKKRYGKYTSEKDRLFQAMLMLQLNNTQSMISFLETEGTFAEPALECIRTLLISVASRKAELPEASLEYLRQSLHTAKDREIVLPYLWFYDSIFPALEELKSEPEFAPLYHRIRTSLTIYRRIMCKKRSTKGVQSNTLTARQIEIVELIGDRLTNKEIAIRLNVSENTIKTTVQAIFKKMNVQKRSELYR